MDIPKQQYLSSITYESIIENTIVALEYFMVGKL